MCATRDGTNFFLLLSLKAVSTFGFYHFIQCSVYSFLVKRIKIILVSIVFPAVLLLFIFQAVAMSGFVLPTFGILKQDIVEVTIVLMVLTAAIIVSKPPGVPR